MEQYCSVPGLKASLRHSVILIDQGAFSKIAGAAEFGSKNGGVRDVVLAFGDPARATDAGNSDFREKLSVYVLPKDGSSAKFLFTGCLPSLSKEERAVASSKKTSVEKFFDGGVEQTVNDASASFRQRLVQALIIAAREAPAEASGVRGPFKDAKVLQSIRNSGRFLQNEGTIPRIILLANLSAAEIGSVSDTAAARKLGFEDAKSASLDLGRAELHVFLNSGSDTGLAKDYASAFFLASGANLVTWSNTSVSTMPLPPTKIVRFTGDVEYPSGPETVSVRLGIDRNGGLSNSWIVLRGSPDRSTPLTGTQINCSSSHTCSYRSDDEGFAQAWSPMPGGQAEFAAEMPFGGVRQWELASDGVKLTGRVFDASMIMSNNRQDMPITGSKVDGANF
ncbi:MAG TPA: hypothetical protein DCL54_07760 [Alphaproteobacteria bacterium]|nr:hypothetical protein [Alphaproteobacteria bacterium]HAJ46459.1 hypothetical protein [Alphaproteobacteria bacterium]